jgi:hypothetical protein
MTLFRQFGNLAAGMLLSTGCGSATAPTPAVRLTLSAVTASGAVLEYEFTIANQSQQTVFLPACDQRVQPDFAMATTPPDRSSGTCIAILLGHPRPLSPGASLTGRGAVLRYPGVRYAPSVRYSFQSDFERSLTAPAATFTAP